MSDNHLTSRKYFYSRVLTSFTACYTFSNIMSTKTYPSLAAYFEDSGETQAAFAKRLGVSQGLVSRWVNRKQCPRRNLALRVANAASVPLSVIIDPESALETIED